MFNQAHQQGLIGTKPQAAVDSTGLEATVRSGYYHQRLRGRRRRIERWPKLTLACETQSHLICAAALGQGPSQDAPQLVPMLLQSSWHLDLDRALADAAFDSEDNHRLAREGMGIRSTIIALNWRGSRRWPKTHYRRQMARRFPRRVYGQRWQVESVFSRLKRRLGSALRSHARAAQQREGRLRVLTHNLMLLAAQPP